MNVGGVTTNVHVEYSDGLTSEASDVPPSARACFPQGAEDHAEGWAGTAIVSSTNYVDLAAVVNVQARSGGDQVGCWAYTATPLSILRRNEKSASGQSLSFPFLVNDYEGWTSEIHLFNPTGTAAVITPRYVLGGSSGRFVYCAEPVTVPAGGMVSISQEQLPSSSHPSMGYFNTTGPVLATVSGTSSQPLGTTDRHFGYEPLSLGGSIGLPDTCGTMHRIFVPLIMKQTP
jgi:hypothetical protein